MRCKSTASTQTIEAMASRPESRLSFLGFGSYSQGDDAAFFERLLGRLTPQGLLQHGEARMIELELKHMLLPLKRGGYISPFMELQEWEKDIQASRSLLNPHGWLVGLVMPAYSTVMRQVYFNETLRRLSLAALQIEKHRLAHGSPPATLDSPLLDPVDQEPRRKRRLRPVEPRARWRGRQRPRLGEGRERNRRPIHRRLGVAHASPRLSR
jgi:hypothetical protein